MAKRIKLDAETLDKKFHYWPKAAAQIAVTGYNEVVIAPTQAINQGAPINFAYTPPMQNYVDLVRSRLVLDLQIVDAAGAAIAGAVRVAPTQLFAQTMWKDIIVKIGKTNLNTTTNGLYPYRAYIESLLGYWDFQRKQRLTEEGWYEDQAGRLNVTNPLAAVDLANSGLAARAGLFAAGAVVQLVMRPRCDVFNQDKCIPAHTDIDLTFYPAADEFILHTIPVDADHPQIRYRLKIINAHFHFFCYEVSASLAIAHESMLAKNIPMVFKEKSIEMQTVNIPAGQTVVNMHKVVDSKFVERLFFILVTQTSKDGDYQQNPLFFDNHNLDRITLRVDNKTFPQNDIAMDFRAATRRTGIIYNSLQRALGVDMNHKLPVGIDPTEYGNGNAIFGFDLTPDASASRGNNLQRESHTDIELHFRVAPAVPLLAIILTERPGEFIIDANHNAVRTS